MLSTSALLQPLHFNNKLKHIFINNNHNFHGSGSQWNHFAAFEGSCANRIKHMNFLWNCELDQRTKNINNWYLCHSPPQYVHIIKFFIQTRRILFYGFSLFDFALLCLSCGRKKNRQGMLKQNQPFYIQ